MMHVRGSARVLHQALRRSRPCSSGNETASVLFSPRVTSSCTFCSSLDRTTSRFSSKYRDGSVYGPTASADVPPEVLASFRRIHSRGWPEGTADSRCPSEGMLGLGGRMTASVGQMFEAVGATVKQQSKDNSPCKFDVLERHVSKAGVPIGREGRIILGLAAGQRSGVAAKGLHPGICNRLGGVVFFGTGRRPGKLPPGMKGKLTGIKAVDSQMTGIKAVDGDKTNTRTSDKGDSVTEKKKVDEKAGDDDDQGLLRILSSDMTMWEKVKGLKNSVALVYKLYFLVAVGTWFTLYVGGFGIVYGALATGVLDPGVDAASAIQSIADLVGMDNNETVSEYVQWAKEQAETHPEFENFILAFIASEFLEFPRDIAVFCLTIPIARALGVAAKKK